MAYEGLQTETVTIRGHNGDMVEAYYARPSKPGKVPGVVVLMHIIGWDEWILETTRRFAHHGYAAIAPNLFQRFGPGSVDDVAARARPAGGASDAEVMGDTAASMAFLRAQANATGKVGVIGYCSGGRHTYLAACTLPNIDAAVDCWGGGVVVNDPSQLTAKRPVAPIDLSATISAPMLGLFGNDDMNPNRADVNKTEETLKKLGKTYEFHRYDGAGHAFLNWNAPSFRSAAAVDAWPKIYAWYGKYLGDGTTGSGAR
jgi:carboxymethylenebutenolidase